jgi:3-deoxy-7-phosphoheptulonate synthase
MAKAAALTGADGLLIEVHPAPEQALSDGEQCINYPEFEKLVEDLKPIRKLCADRKTATVSG